MNRYCMGVVACLALGACNAGAPNEPGVSTVSQAIESGPAHNAPVDSTPQLIQSGKPRYTQESPPARPATRDEIEDLNGTYRTEGSRDRLLRRIQFARTDKSRELLTAVFERAASRLPADERGKAEAKLAAALNAGGPQ